MEKRLLIAALALVLVFAAVAGASAVGTAGSEEDPLVTQSYVDARTGYDTISIDAGQQLIGGQGTEIIVRSGDVVVVTQGVDGLSDVTAGADVKNGGTAVKNHLLLCPRDDGRGIEARTSAWIMVRGIYTVK